MYTIPGKVSLFIFSLDIVEKKLNILSLLNGSYYLIHDSMLIELANHSPQWNDSCTSYEKEQSCVSNSRNRWLHKIIISYLFTYLLVFSQKYSLHYITVADRKIAWWKLPEMRIALSQKLPGVRICCTEKLPLYILVPDMVLWPAQVNGQIFFSTTSSDAR
jgi:hypothetical protein